MPFPSLDVDTSVTLLNKAPNPWFKKAKLFRCFRMLWTDDAPASLGTKAHMAKHRLVISTDSSEQIKELQQRSGHGAQRVTLYRSKPDPASECMQHWAISPSLFASRSGSKVFEIISVHLISPDDKRFQLPLSTWRALMMQKHDFCVRKKSFRQPLDSDAKPAHHRCVFCMDRSFACVVQDSKSSKSSSGNGGPRRRPPKQTKAQPENKPDHSNMHDDDRESKSDQEGSTQEPNDDGAIHREPHAAGQDQIEQSGQDSATLDGSERSSDSESSCSQSSSANSSSADASTDSGDCDGSDDDEQQARGPNQRAAALSAAKRQFKFEFMNKLLKERFRLAHQSVVSCQGRPSMLSRAVACPVPLELLEFNHLQIGNKSSKRMNWGDITTRSMYTIFRELQTNFDTRTGTWLYQFVCAEHHRDYHQREHAGKTQPTIRRLWVNQWMRNRLRQSDCCASSSTGFPCLWGDLLPLRQGREYLFDLDHIDPTTKVANVSQMVRSGCSQAQLQLELDKVRPLHASCHKRRTHQPRLEAALPATAPSEVREACRSAAGGDGPPHQFTDDAAYQSLLKDLHSFVDAMQSQAAHGQRTQSDLLDKYMARHRKRQSRKHLKQSRGGGRARDAVPSSEFQLEPDDSAAALAPVVAAVDVVDQNVFDFLFDSYTRLEAESHAHQERSRLRVAEGSLRKDVVQRLRALASAIHKWDSAKQANSNAPRRTTIKSITVTQLFKLKNGCAGTKRAAGAASASLHQLDASLNDQAFWQRWHTEDRATFDEAMLCFRQRGMSLYDERFALRDIAAIATAASEPRASAASSVDGRDFRKRGIKAASKPPSTAASAPCSCKGAGISRHCPQHGAQ